MTSHRLWYTTGFARYVCNIIEVISILKRVAEGNSWSKTTQKKFEREIGKTQNKVCDTDAGGASEIKRWVLGAKVFGFWYEECGKVKLAPSSEKIILGGEDAIKQLRHQLLTFQWPNETQDKKSRMSSDFTIFPYRFMLKILLDPRIMYLLTGEIALFVLQTKNEGEFEEVVKKILEYRQKRKVDSKTLSARIDLIEDHKKFRPSMASNPEYTHHTHWRYIVNLAITFMTHLEIFEEIVHGISKHGGPEKQVSISENKAEKMRMLISTYDVRFPLFESFNPIKNALAPKKMR